MKNSSNALKRIVIIGDGLRAALPAAYLAARCGASGSQIQVIPSCEGAIDTGMVSARPNIRHLHQLLKIPEVQILGPAQGQRAYAMDVNLGRSGLITPFGAYGRAHKGAAFSHLHTRLSQLQSVPDLQHYNINLRLHALGAKAPFLPKADFGYVFPRPVYAALLRHHAQAKGAVFMNSSFVSVNKKGSSDYIESVKTTHGNIISDCVIDVTLSGKADQVKPAAWHGNCLHINLDDDWPGIELYRLQAAMERLSDFMPDQSFNTHELAEYNRLAQLEGERISDMRAFVTKGLMAGEARTTLQRKIDLFLARGRIPLEDYEVFTAPEWRAAFMSQGLKPKYYDRLADVLSESELRNYVTLLDKDIAVQLRDAKGEG